MRYRPTLRTVLPSVALVGLGVAAFAGGACGGAVPTTQTPGSLIAVSAAAGKCEAAESSLKPVQNQGQGSTVALGKFADGPLAGKTLAFVADEDAQAVIVVDVDTKKELGTHKLSSKPSQLVILADGRVAVTLRDASKLQILHPASDGTFADGCAVDTDAEPIALAVSPDASTLLVTNGWGHSVQAFETSGFTKKARIDVPREPRSVVIDDAGKYAYVSHAVGGRISTIELSSMRANDTRILSNPSMMQDQSQTFTLTSAVSGALGNNGEADTPGRFGTRVGCQGYPITKSTTPAGRILAPQVLVDPGDPENRTAGYGDGNNPTEVTNVAVIDAGNQRIVNASLQDTIQRQQFFGNDPNEPAMGDCILPRAATVDPGSQSLLVTCLGIDAVVAYDASSASPASVEKARWDVGSGPTGVAVDTDHKRAIVWSQFDRTIEIIDLETVNATDGTPARPDRLALGPMANPMPLGVVLGRQIFHTVGDSRISKDGRSCASCHPDGRDDSITWATPDGPRRTVILAGGRLENTAPFAWAGTSKDLRDHLHHTFERLNGQGLRSVELESLVSYLESLPAPPTEQTDDMALVAHGKDIFTSKEAECSTCHAEGGTDNKDHDVQSRDHADKKADFNTPSLKYVGGHAPYFHDGRYETLRDLLVKSDGQMGHTKQLKPADMDALEAYLRSL